VRGRKGTTRKEGLKTLGRRTIIISNKKKKKEGEIYRLRERILGITIIGREACELGEGGPDRNKTGKKNVAYGHGPGRICGGEESRGAWGGV